MIIRHLAPFFALLLFLPAYPENTPRVRKTFEQYLRESAVPRSTIDNFLQGPAWPSSIRSWDTVWGTTCPVTASTKAPPYRQSKRTDHALPFSTRGKNAGSTPMAIVLRCATKSVTVRLGKNTWLAISANRSEILAWEVTGFTRPIGA